MTRNAKQRETILSSELDFLYASAVVARGVAVGAALAEGSHVGPAPAPDRDHGERSIVARAASRLGWGEVTLLWDRGIQAGMAAVVRKRVLVDDERPRAAYDARRDAGERVDPVLGQ